MANYQSYFSNSFQGINDFVKNIVIPIFGKVADVQKDYTSTNQTQCDRANVKSMKLYGGFDIPGTHVDIWDITVKDNCHLDRARQGIRDCIKPMTEDYSGAFVVFHYENCDNQTWRFSWLNFGKNQSDVNNAKRYTYLCGPAYPCRTIAERFKELAKETNITLASITKAFDVEALSEEFFKEYKVLYDDIIQYITGQRYVKKKNGWEVKSNVNDNKVDSNAPGNAIYEAFLEKFKDEDNTTKAIRNYVKKLMGRLVFIQFVQKKGWLQINDNISCNFLLDVFNQVSDVSRDNFIEAVLEKVVYLLLNTDHTNKGKIDNISIDVPFLNGGLFQQDEYDAIDVKLPKEFFHNEDHKDTKRAFGDSALRANDEFFEQCGLLDLFYQYNFTIDENDPNDAEVGVDPEMLGKIFENLLEDNKDKGAFYTPKEIVNYMCCESLIAYLQTDINDDKNKDAIRQFVTTYDASVLSEELNIVQKLKEVKICDPAVGSGAFPMGLLNLIVRLRCNLENITTAAQRCELKKEIICNNIYGVDIEKGAIDIARLRFWLNIVVDLDKPEPLPNFDFKFMQGNSLLECYEGIDLSELLTMKKRRKCEVSCDLFGNITGTDEDALYLPDYLYDFDLSDALSGYFGIKDSIKKKEARERIEEYIRCAICATLSIQKLNKQQEHLPLEQNDNRNKKKQKEYDKTQAECNRIDQAISELEEKSAINDKFFLWHTWFANILKKDDSGKEGGFDIVIGNPPYVSVKSISDKDKKTFQQAFKTAKGRFNLFTLFIEKAYQKCCCKGLICMIIPEGIYSNIEYQYSRELLATKTCIQRLCVFTKRVFEASVDTTIFLTRKEQGINDFIPIDCNVNEIFSEISQKTINKYPYYLIPSKLTGADKEFVEHLILSTKFDRMKDNTEIQQGIIYTGQAREDVFSDYAKDSTYKPILDGRDISKWRINWDQKEYDLYLSYTNKLHRPREERLFTASQKILFPRRATSIVATIDNNQFYVLNTAYICLLKGTKYRIEYILAILNSRLVNFLYSKLFMGWQITIPAIDVIPIAKISLEEQNKIRCLVNGLLTKKQANPSADTTDLEREIDRLVYELYGLTNGEVKIIDPEAAVSGVDDELFKA